MINIPYAKAKAFMEEKGMSQKRFAEIMGAKQQTISAWKREGFTPSVLVNTLFDVILSVPGAFEFLSKRTPEIVYRKRVVVSTGAVKYVKTKGRSKKTKVGVSAAKLAAAKAKLDDEIARMRREGKDYTAIRMALGVTHHDIARVATERGLSITHSRKKITPEEKQTAINMYAGGSSLYDIAERLSIAYVTAGRIVGWGKNGGTRHRVRRKEQEEDSNSERDAGDIHGKQGSVPHLQQADSSAPGGEVASGPREPSGERGFKYFIKSQTGTRRLSLKEIEQRKNGVSQGPEGRHEVPRDQACQETHARIKGERVEAAHGRNHGET